MKETACGQHNVTPYKIAIVGFACLSQDKMPYPEASHARKSILIICSKMGGLSLKVGGLAELYENIIPLERLYTLGHYFWSSQYDV